MWPKMLIELLPHLSRLVPMWDKFLASRASSDKATEAAIASMAASSEGIRGDLGQVTAAHAALYRQLQDQSAQIVLLEDEIRIARVAAERAESATRALEPTVESLAKWLKGGIAAIVLLLLVVIGLELTHHGL